MTDAELAELARRQGATHVLAAAARLRGDPAEARWNCSGSRGGTRSTGSGRRGADRNGLGRESLEKNCRAPFSIRIERLKQVREG